METNIENGNVAESLLQDENVMELLALLKQYKEKSLEQGVYDTVNNVENLEYTFYDDGTDDEYPAGIIQNARANNELIVAVNHTVKDTVIENIQKVEQKVQELHAKLNNVRERIINTAKAIVENAKQLGKYALIKDNQKYVMAFTSKERFQVCNGILGLGSLNTIAP